MTNETEISEALTRAMTIAEEQAPVRPDPGLAPGSHGTLSAPERAKYRAYVLSKEEVQHQAHAAEMLDACRLAEPVQDEGYETFPAWRTRIGALHQGSGAMKLARLWRATRRKVVS